VNSTVKTIVPVLIATLSSVAAWGFPFGPPNGFTVAPGDKPGVACTQCHAGTPLNGGGGGVGLAFPSGLTYTPGQAQNISIVIDDAIAAIYGFQISARLESGPNTQQAGTFTAGQNQKIVCSNNAVQPPEGCGGTGIQWLEHTQPSLSNTIAVQWTPPTGSSGNVHFYVSANAANGDNSPRNDHIYATDYVLTPASTSTANVPTVTNITNAASGAATAEAGSWIAITGTNFASAATSWDNFIVTNVFPTTLAGVTVAIDGRPAPISFVNPTQINALVPATKTLGNVTVVVSNAAGSSAPATAVLAPASPGMFTFPQNQGKYIAGAVLDSPTSFEYLAPAGLLGSSTQSRPAKAGDEILLFGTGFGPTTTLLNPEIAVDVAYPLSHTGGDISKPLAQVTVGGQTAKLLFCGIVSPGTYQINAVLPAGLTAGDQPVTVTLLSGPAVTQTVFIPVQ
jgi:uncharacterized protein (TIGR03437 family)